MSCATTPFGSSPNSGNSDQNASLMKFGSKLFKDSCFVKENGNRLQQSMTDPMKIVRNTVRNAEKLELGQEMK
jgi:hypothetical protein